MTLTFLRLGRVYPWDALFYVNAQFVGGTLGLLLAAVALSGTLSAPGVDYVVTVPGTTGTLAAFAAEAAMSLALMGAILVAANVLRLAHLTRAIAGSLLAVFIAVEAPVSGMSINPARTVTSAVAARPWTGVWVYLLAPTLGMLGAGQAFAWVSARPARTAKPAHDNRVRWVFSLPPPWPAPAHARALPAAARISGYLGGRRKDMTADHYDVIVIGTGAGGGTLAHRLAPSGKRILLLERGDWLPRELDNWDSRAVFVEFKYQARETWHDAAGRVFHPGIHYYVGGNTKVYGGALLRFRREDFGEVKHHGGISPAWPLSYEEFEPYYTQAEHLYQVHGRHGVDPTEPEASAEYPFPPMSHEPRIQEISDGLTRAGYHPFHLPLGILLEEEDGKPTRRSRCIRCGKFDGFPCLVGAKADSQVICVEPLLERPNVELLTRAYVSRLETDASGREVVRVVVERDGETLGLSADVVVSSCGAINSALLLLRSASDAHPNGLANSSGVVGRHYMRHNNAAVLAISREPNPTVFEKTMGVNDLYFGAEDFDYPLGHIQMLGKSDEEMIMGEAPDWAIWKPKMALDVLARHAVDFWLTSEDLPDSENRVTLGAGGRVELRLRENNLEGHRRLKAKLKQMLRHIGCHEDYLLPRSLYLGKHIPIGGTAHQCGTVQFGTDPASSALDTNCKAHDLDNLYVVDGGFFVSAAAVNPGLTIMANALRVGDHLLERLR